MKKLQFEEENSMANITVTETFKKNISNRIENQKKYNHKLEEYLNFNNKIHYFEELIFIKDQNSQNFTTLNNNVLKTTELPLPIFSPLSRRAADSENNKYPKIEQFSKGSTDKYDYYQLKLEINKYFHILSKYFFQLKSFKVTPIKILPFLAQTDFKLISYPKSSILIKLEREKRSLYLESKKLNKLKNKLDSWLGQGFYLKKSSVTLLNFLFNRNLYRTMRNTRRLKYYKELKLEIGPDLKYLYPIFPISYPLKDFYTATRIYKVSQLDTELPVSRSIEQGNNKKSLNLKISITILLKRGLILISNLSYLINRKKMDIKNLISLDNINNIINTNSKFTETKFFNSELELELNKLEYSSLDSNYSSEAGYSSIAGAGSPEGENYCHSYAGGVASEENKEFCNPCLCPISQRRGKGKSLKIIETAPTIDQISEKTLFNYKVVGLKEKIGGQTLNQIFKPSPACAQSVRSQDGARVKDNLGFEVPVLASLPFSVLYSNNIKVSKGNVGENSLKLDSNKNTVTSHFNLIRDTVQQTTQINNSPCPRTVSGKGENKTEIINSINNLNIKEQVSPIYAAEAPRTLRLRTEEATATATVEKIVHKPILSHYLKELSIYNIKNKGIIIFYYILIGFHFKTDLNKFYTSKKVYKLLAASFKSMYCLISKPVFITTPDKIIVQLFYYLFIPNVLKLKKFFKYNNSYPNLGRVGPSFKKQRILRKKIIRKQFNKFRKIKINVRVKLRKLSNLSLVKVFPTKFKFLSLILNDMFKKPVVFDLVRIHYPYNDSNILVNLLGIMINKIKLRLIIRRFFEKAIIKNKNNLCVAEKRGGIIPSFLSGVTIRVAGRLLTQKVVPKKTVTTKSRGASAPGRINFKDIATYTNKNKRGAYSITVKAGQNLI